MTQETLPGGPPPRLPEAGLPAEALAAVPGCEQGQVPYELAPLVGGPANRSFLTRTSRGAFVVRLNEPASALLGVDRVRERTLHVAAAAAGLAPRLIAADPAGHFLVTQYVAGRALETRDMADRGCLSALARHLRALHALTVPRVAAFDPGALLAVHARRIAAADAGAARELEPLIERGLLVLERAAAVGRTACIVHNDLHHSNVLRGERLWLIDFEYAAVTDPLFDLACLTAYYPASAVHARLLLEESGLAPHASVTMLTEAAWLYVLLSYLWYRALRLTTPANAADTAAEQALAQRLRQGF